MTPFGIGARGALAGLRKSSKGSYEREALYLSPPGRRCPYPETGTPENAIKAKIGISKIQGILVMERELVFQRRPCVAMEENHGSLPIETRWTRIPTEFVARSFCEVA